RAGAWRTQQDRDARDLGQPVLCEEALKGFLGIVCGVPDDDRKADRHLDRGWVAPDVAAMPEKRFHLAARFVDEPTRVPGVRVAGNRPQCLPRTRAADQDRQVRLDGGRLADGLIQPVVVALMRDAVAVEQAAQQRHRLLEPGEPLADAAAELGGEGIMLAPEPCAAN